MATISIDKKRIGVELYTHPDPGKMGFRALLTERDIVEREFGEALDWQELPGKKTWRIGARCTGVDIADDAIAAARNAAAVLGLPVRFIRSDVYDLALDELFDIVYVSKGARYWLEDFAGFARIVAQLLAPGGRVYIYEEHSLLPFMLELEPTAYNPASGDLNYFHDAKPTSSVGLDYVGLSGEGTKCSYEWQWTLGDIVTGLAQAGLRIEFLREWPFISSFKYWDWLEEREEDGTFYIPADRPQLPLSFSLQARRD